jgi:hypothetical protein
VDKRCNKGPPAKASLIRRRRTTRRDIFVPARISGIRVQDRLRGRTRRLSVQRFDQLHGALIAEQAARVELLGVKELFQRPALAFAAAREAAMAEVNVKGPGNYRRRARPPQGRNRISSREQRCRSA